jgi:hydroxypyruvate reductase
LTDKQTVTRLLSRGGANIRELNCVRKQLSRIKGGRLASACRAGTLIALIISDIAGDPLDVIGSGPTVSDPSTPADALGVLKKFDPQLDQTPASILAHLREQAANHSGPHEITIQVFNHIIGNNQVALRAAETTARQLGYEVPAIETNVEGVAADLGRGLAGRCQSLAIDGHAAPRCLLSGGEPVVRIHPSSRPQKGGRNQELALAAVTECWSTEMAGFCVLSGGTDGEDGPTDAAGAIADQAVIDTARHLELDPAEFLADHNSYEFFDRTGGLLKTGPTHTNVMDVRVVLIDSQRK